MHFPTSKFLLSGILAFSYLAQHFVHGHGYLRKHCCSFDMMNCQTTDWCNASSGNCSGPCKGNWISTSPPADCRIPKWGDCTNDVDGCCAPSVCTGNSIYYKQCLLSPPTPNPTSSPTEAPIDPSTGDSSEHCCSFDMMNCQTTDWCNASSGNCSGPCKGNWISTSPPADCRIPKWGDCTNDVDGCCAPSVCTGNSIYYKQCL